MRKAGMLLQVTMLRCKARVLQENARKGQGAIPSLEWSTSGCFPLTIQTVSCPDVVCTRTTQWKPTVAAVCTSGFCSSTNTIHNCKGVLQRYLLKCSVLRQEHTEHARHSGNTATCLPRPGSRYRSSHAASTPPPALVLPLARWCYHYACTDSLESRGSAHIIGGFGLTELKVGCCTTSPQISIRNIFQSSTILFHTLTARQQWRPVLQKSPKCSKEAEGLRPLVPIACLTASFSLAIPSQSSTTNDVSWDPTW